MKRKRTTFALAEVNALRQRIADALQVGDDRPQGWVSWPIDERRILAAVPGLTLRPGWRLSAYLLTAGDNGNGVVWAIPADQPDVSPAACPPGRDWLSTPRPPEAMPVLEALTGDGSAAAYLQASLLHREIGEFGALWHGRAWSDHDILDTAAVKALSGSSWHWQHRRPVNASPSCAVFADGRAQLRFWSRSAQGRETLSSSLDSYPPAAMLPDTRDEVVAEGEGGFIY